MNSELLKFLEDLLSAYGPSGFEQDVQNVYKDFAGQYADKIYTDYHGNVVASKQGTGKLKVMVCGHADEIGLMVSHIDSDGFIYCKAIGGVDGCLLPGLMVNIHHDGSKIKGVIGREACHLLGSNKNSAPTVKSVWIDIGATDKEDALKKVAIGDPVTFRAGITTLNTDIVASKSTDNRTGVWVAGGLLKKIADSKEDLAATVFAASTVQEEVGIRGARTCAYGIKPDIAIAIDVTFTSDIPGSCKKELGDVALGKGPVLAISPIVNPRLLKLLKDVADEVGIKYQIETAPMRTGTDADQIQLCGKGVATALVSIPTRYMHSPNEIISLNDLQHTLDLIYEFVKRLDDDTVLIP